MIEREVLVPTAHGLMPSFVAAPEGPGRWPAIIFYMDARGMREELHNMARRIAKQGYFCIVPDLYYRLGTMRFDMTRRDDAMAAVTRACTQACVHYDNSMQDTAAMLAFLDAQDECKPGPVGAVGHCMGGALVTWAAQRFPHRIRAAAALYGVRLVTDKPDSPHLHFSSDMGEIFYGFASLDPKSQPDFVKEFGGILNAAGVNNTIKVYDDAHHGFCFAERSVYHPKASEAAWTELFALWERNLH